jgi:preprotein translocase SecE subunit
MAAYKQDQGRMVRMAVFWSIAVLLFHGCSSLRRELAGRFSSTLGEPLFAALDRIPVLGIRLSGALLIAVVVFAGGLFVAYRWQEKPKNAELLIETETELRKVTWPTGQEVFNSSMVVVVCVVLLMAFLAAADWLLARLITPLIFS